MTFVALCHGLRPAIVALCSIFIVCFWFSPSVSHAEETDSAAGSTVERGIVDATIESDAHLQGKDTRTGLSSHLLDAGIDTIELEYRLNPLTKDELAALAGEWLGIVKSKTEEVTAAQIAIHKTQDTIEDAAREKLTELTQEQRALFDKYATVISDWEKKGGNAEKIAGYRAYQSAIIIEETRQTDFKSLLALAQAWLVDRNGGVDVALSLMVIVGSLLGLLFFARIVRRLVLRGIGHIPNVSKLLQLFLVTVIYWLVIVIGLMIVLSALGIDISPAFALIGGASFILAFAFQDTLGNLASGLMIMINRPFDQGHYVDVGGVAGTVQAVSIFATTVVTPDNQVIVIPNKNVWGNVITNVTASETRRVDLVFGISYEDSIAEAAGVIEDTVKNHPLVLDEPEPVIRVHELADSSVNFVCRPWTKTSDYWTVYWDITQQVKERFDAAEISIPYPQQDVHVRQISPTA